jgi:acetyl-CoA synthetase
MISPLPGITTTKPGSATKPLPGVFADVVDDRGEPVPLGEGGYLVLTRPWPSMLRGIYGDPERYKATYWSKFPGMYFAGDGARRDEDGDYWLMGRVDDVMNVSGHRLSTTEIESALVDDKRVAEAAVVGRQDDLTGESIFCFVILKSGIEPNAALGESCSRRICRKPAPARSCGGSCVISPSDGSSATRPPSPMRALWNLSAKRH